MFCRNCGTQLKDDALFCTNCGTSVNTQPAQPVYQQPVYQQPKAHPNDSGSWGWFFLGFFIPLVGLILFLIWKDEKPLSAKRAGIGALTGVIANIVLSILGGVLLGFLIALDEVYLSDYYAQLLPFLFKL
ncbi:MAG: zinc-ribbon domain-containing protein [Clostridia bacterium]|nr:zinc-ribbon domain-containing protein [Clostridia bacterium]